MQGGDIKSRFNTVAMSIGFGSSSEFVSQLSSDLYDLGQVIYLLSLGLISNVERMACDNAFKTISMVPNIQ